MKARYLALLVTFLLAFSMVPNVSAGTIEIKNDTFSPDPFKEGDTMHVTAKVISTADLDWVRLFPCWEKPTYTCGMPSEMTDADSDGVYEGDYSHQDWTTGNIIHLNITAKDKDGVQVSLLMDLITVGGGGTGGPSDYTNEGDCKDAGYHWWDDACHENEKTVDDYKDEITCEAAGYSWYDNKCNAETGTPEKYTTKDDCLDEGYYWWDGKCHDKKKPAENGGFIPGFEIVFVVAAIVAVGAILSRRR